MHELEIRDEFSSAFFRIADSDAFEHLINANAPLESEKEIKMDGADFSPFLHPPRTTVIRNCCQHLKRSKESTAEGLIFNSFWNDPNKNCI